MVENGTLPLPQNTNNMFADTMDALSRHATIIADAVQFNGCASPAFHFTLCAKLRAKAEVTEVNLSIFRF